MVGWAQTPMIRRTDLSETQLLLRVITDALEPLGLTRADIDFTCLGSCDYITGQAFSFVSNLDAIGAWPPKRDSHVEMDGAWALYEAWLRLQEGDIEIAVVTGSGRSSTGDPALIYPMEMDPFYLAPLGADPVTFAALQARALIAAGITDERDDGRGRGPIAARRAEQPGRAGVRATPTSTRCWPTTTCASRCAATTCRRSPTARRRWCSRPATRARELRDRPAFITGFDHRTECHNPGVPRPHRLAVDPHRRRGRGARRRPGRGRGAAGRVQPRGDPAAPGARPRRRRRRSTRRAARSRRTRSWRPGSPASGTPPNHVFGGGKRALAHSTSGPCLQQNLVCILEEDA